LNVLKSLAASNQFGNEGIYGGGVKYGTAGHCASSRWQKSSRIGNAGETACATIANQQFAA
jgi:hypothetical protein